MMTEQDARAPDDAWQARRCGILEQVLPHANVSVLYQDDRFTYLWDRNIPAILGVDTVVGQTDRDIFQGHDADTVDRLKREVLASGELRSVELQIDHPRRTRWFNLIIEVDRDGDGVIVGLITTMIDSTEQKHREQTLTTLLREVSHRSKNLLAIILSIATQTGRYSKTIEIFVSRFRGRIQSIAYSQDLVTSSNWRGASVRELVRQQTSKYCADPARNIAFEGPNVSLNPNATLHVGLGIHELAVNSVSFGALSERDGVIDIATAIGADGLMLRWTEKLPKAAPLHMGEKRFGSVALERIVPAAINGKSRLALDNGVLTFELDVPANQYEL